MRASVLAIIVAGSQATRQRGKHDGVKVLFVHGNLNGHGWPLIIGVFLLGNDRVELPIHGQMLLRHSQAHDVVHQTVGVPQHSEEGEDGKKQLEYYASETRVHLHVGNKEKQRPAERHEEAKHSCVLTDSRGSAARNLCFARDVVLCLSGLEGDARLAVCIAWANHGMKTPYRPHHFGVQSFLVDHLDKLVRIDVREQQRLGRRVRCRRSLASHLFLPVGATSRVFSLETVHGRHARNLRAVQAAFGRAGLIGRRSQRIH
mmetsp:Transcript_6646/g.17881  ORF Transcript_6646/g.17881 Transcript_6646/m.17881 type:complete len:260 (+) Transcript_6646:634-1413(+)